MAQDWTFDIKKHIKEFMEILKAEIMEGLLREIKLRYPLMKREKD